MMKCTLGIVCCVVLAVASCSRCPPSILVRPCKCSDEDGLTLQCWNLTSKSTLDGISRRTGKIQFKKMYVFQSTLPIPTKFLLQKQIQSLDLVESNFTSNFLDVNHHRSFSNSTIDHPLPNSLIYHSLLDSLANYSLPQTKVRESLQNSIINHILPISTVYHSQTSYEASQSFSNSTLQHSLSRSTVNHLLHNSAVQLSLPNSTVQPPLANSTVQTPLPNTTFHHTSYKSTGQHSSKKPSDHHLMAKEKVQHASKNPRNRQSMAKTKKTIPKDHTLTMEAVHLYDNYFTDGVSWRQFLELRRLRFLLAFKVDIRHLEYSFRLYVSKTLERLHFWRTGTAYLEEEVFMGFTKLIDVRIQECMLTELKRSYFPRPAKIQIMSFDGNQIQSLPDDIFEEMPDLRSVDLSKNQLSAVSETVFGSVYNHLGDLSLSGNPISCNCNISWIVPLQGHRYLDGYCIEPESLKERSLVTLRNGDFEFCRENTTET